MQLNKHIYKTKNIFLQMEASDTTNEERSTGFEQENKDCFLAPG